MSNRYFILFSFEGDFIFVFTTYHKEEEICQIKRDSPSASIEILDVDKFMPGMWQLIEFMEQAKEDDGNSIATALKGLLVAAVESGLQTQGHGADLSEQEVARLFVDTVDEDDEGVYSLLDSEDTRQAILTLIQRAWRLGFMLNASINPNAESPQA